MTVIDQIAKRIEHLSESHRREVLDFVAFIENQESEEDMGSEWSRKLDQRIKEIEGGRAKGLPAEIVIREMRAKYG